MFEGKKKETKGLRPPVIEKEGGKVAELMEAVREAGQGVDGERER